MQDTELEVWVRRLVDQNMPLFTRTVRCVSGTANRDDSSFSELAWSILQDPTLTAEILKMSNSMYYNPYAKRINTVSRAVMRLGFDTVKAMCLSIALVETVLTSLHRDQVALEIARAFHAAVQAKKIAMKRNLPIPEEVFIAALMTRIGQIAFWCFAGEIGDRLELAVNQTLNEENAELEVLGFKLERLTLRLVQEWKLSQLLESVLKSKKSSDPKAQSINLGYAIAQSSEMGWDSLQVKRVVKDVQEFLKISEDEATRTLHDSARAAAEITKSYGARKSSRLIPIPKNAPAAKAESKKEYPKPDHQVQLTSLRDLSAVMTSKKGDVNMVLSILLEGIYRGVGMDRVIFALLAPDRQHLKGKYGLGWERESWIEEFQISANQLKPNMFSFILKYAKPFWVTDEPGNEVMSLLTKEMSDLLGSGPFYIMPISIRNTPIGVVYSDRNLSGRELDDEGFDSFSFFGQQANLCLAALAGA